MIYFPSDDYMSNQHQSIGTTHFLVNVESRQSKLTRGNRRMIDWTKHVEHRKQVDYVSCEAHRVREEYIYPSAHHTRANVNIEEEIMDPRI